MPLSAPRILKLFCALILLLCMSGCATKPPEAAAWPRDMPPRSYFVDYYSADIENQKSVQDLDEYLMWVLRFYQGWELYRNGWLKVTDTAVIAAKNPTMAIEVKSKMDELGKIVAAEWAKNKKTKRILTRHVAVWGNSMLEAIRRDQEIPLIDKVIADAKSLISKDLDLASVKPERYFPPDKDDVFGP